ncbi:MAG: type I polyketide synthase, partial [Rhodospirillales bacterium]
MTAPGDCDVAIIGMSGLFPRAPDIGRFWRNILDKVDAVGDAPPGWLVDESFFDPTGERRGISVYTTRGGFLNELSQFDPRPFGTMPISVVGGEPDQFLALKASAEALADAGYASGFDSHRCGIILGHAIHANRANVNGFQHSIVVDQTIHVIRSLFPDAGPEKIAAVEAMLVAKLPQLNVDTVPGLVPNMMTGRIANRLDLMGPNFIMDAACASSLIAVEAAISELRFGRADLMLAGGVNTTTSPLVYAVFCMLEALSRTSRIRPFDKAANGTLLGEGQGIVVLKRLDDALRDDDRIYAVVKAVGTSSDGRAMGLMAPRLEGEVLAMKRAYAQSGVDPGTIGLVEAHGTGIPLGDRTEVEALRQVLGGRERSYPHVALGSVKSMIGHCIPAAGAASLIKTCLALHHKILPPTLVDEINPDLGLETTPLYLNTEAAPWIRPGLHPRRAAINAFGFGGVNSHMILEEAPGSSETVDPTAAFALRPPAAAVLLVFAADSRDHLAAAVRSVRERLQNRSPTPIAALAAETIRSAGAGDHRAAIVAADATDLGKKLDQLLARLADGSVHRMVGRNGLYFTDRPIEGAIAFLFPGENSQYPGMLRDLAVSSPAARQWFDMLERLFPGEREIPHSVLMFPPPNNLGDDERKRLERQLLEVDAGSEAVFFADQALFSVLSCLGVRPSFIVGHSTGENAALIASGLTDLSQDAVGRYIVEMNRIFRKLMHDRSVPEGSLLTVGALSRQTLLDILSAETDVWFTMDNCPNQAVLFGPSAVIDDLAGKLSAAGGLCLKLPLVWAYHTPFVTPMAEAFEALFSEIEFRQPIAPVFSCASADVFPNDRGPILELMKRQYVSRVRFTEVIERLYDQGARIFVEVGPNNNLTGFVRDILRDRAHVAVAADDPKR